MKMQVAPTTQRPRGVVLTASTVPSKPPPGGLAKAVGDVRVVEQPARGGKAARTTVTVSLGSAADCKVHTCRDAGGVAVKWLDNHNVRSATVDLSGVEALGVDGAVEAFCEGLALGAFRFDRHKSKNRKSRLASLDVKSRRRRTEFQRTIRRIVTVADAVDLAREWAHEPPNVINPVTLGRRIATLARACDLKCTIHDEKKLAKMKAGALLSVGVASKTPARLIVLEHRGRSRATGARPVILVGKAITFDTGGYSLKDKEGIVGMKYDKCGGLAVVAVMKAVAALKLKTPVVGIVAAAENMISGQAYRPNDIVTTMSKKTVEIISTDAEGRLVLADALTYAQKHYNPRAIIDLATLTGGVVVALGAVRAGLFANDERLADALRAAGERVHERLWRLPLDDEYLELIKGEDSDLKNSAGRSAHPVIGAMFLREFVDKKVPWAHLDIAGTATCDKDLPFCPKGATGFGVRLLIDYLERL